MARKLGFYFLWLSLIMIVVFVLQNLFAGFTGLFVLNLSAIYEFQIWRFVTAIFLHGNLVHLLYNLFALLFFGVILEKYIGSKNFLIVFFVSGIVSNLISVNFYSSSLGASGAIYGIIGCVTVLNPMMMVWAFGIMMPMFVASIVWVIADLLRVMGFNPGNVGSIAHLSGIVVGFLIGGLLRARISRGKVKRKEKFEIPEVYIDEWERNYMRR